MTRKHTYLEERRTRGWTEQGTRNIGVHRHIPGTLGETQARGSLESVHPPDPETSNVHQEVGRSHDVLMQEVLCVCYVGWLGRAITCQYLCTLRLNGTMPFWLKGQRWGEEISLPLELACYDLSFLEQDHSRHGLGLKGEGTFGTSNGACPLP